MSKLFSNKKLLFGGCVTPLLIAVFLFTPIIPASNIYIQNNILYSDDEISQYVPINNNFISVINKIRIGNLIKNNLPYVHSVSTNYSGDGLYITVYEDVYLGDVSFNGTYFQLSYNGTVTDNTTHSTGPLLEGFSFEELKLGKLAYPLEESKLKAAQMIAPLLVKYDLLNSITHINISNPDKLYIGAGELEAYFGTTENLEKKIQWLKEVSKEHSSGLLDLSQIERSQAILTPLM